MLVYSTNLVFPSHLYVCVTQGRGEEPGEGGEHTPPPTPTGKC